MIKEAIQALIEGETLTREQSHQTLLDVLRGEATPANAKNRPNSNHFLIIFTID